MFTSSEREILLADLTRIGEEGAALTKAVFEHWFQQAPDAANLFAIYSLASRREMVDATTVAIYDLVEGASWLKWNLVAYGARHAGTYEVRDEMYPAYVDAMLVGLREVIGADFDAIHESVWRKALERVATAMQQWRSVDRVSGLLAPNPSA